MKTNNRWTSADMPDQTGKIAVITGANSGIGYETALALARKNAHVVMACRNLEKAETARAQIAKQIPNASLEAIRLDLASLASIRAFVEEFTSRYDSMGALSQLYAATAPEVQGDEFYGPRFYLRGYPRRQRASRAAYNPDSAVRLWQISEQLTGVKYDWKYG